MNHIPKNTLIIFIPVIGVLAGFGILLRNGTVKKAPLALPKQATAEIKSTKIRHPAQPPLEIAGVPAKEEIIYGRVKGGPANAIMLLRQRKPEYNLTEQDVVTLQQIFNKNYVEFLSVRDELTKSRRIDGGAIEIEVPAFPEIGKTILDDFLTNSQKYLTGRDGGLVKDLESTFNGYTEQAGTNSVTYLVKPEGNSQTNFKYVREVVMADRLTKEVKGTGIVYGTIDLSKEVDPLFVTAIQNSSTK
jgi:hypothetical protein